METRNKLDVLYPQMVKWRRFLHQAPELSYQEERTSRFVAELLRGWGIEVKEKVGGHGVVATIRGFRPGPTVALRADMDALPIQDEKTRPYASKVPGVMHACGHDAHTSTLLAVAQWLQEARDLLCGNVVCLFQPAEETAPGGAGPMIADGALKGVDVIYGAHLWTPFPIGTAWSTPGAVMAAADEFQIEIRGKGGHGGLPHESIDTIAIGAQLVTNWQTVVSRFINPLEPCVVSVGTFQAGSAFNVIAETCRMSGTVRTFNQKVRDKVRARMEQIAVETCQMHGAQARFAYKVGYPPVVNDAQETERFFRVAAKQLGENNTGRCQPLMAGEDFAYYLQKVPGCFIFVGAGGEEAEAVYPHHHPKFDIDERAMLHAGKLLAGLALDYLGLHDPRKCME